MEIYKTTRILGRYSDHILKKLQVTTTELCKCTSTKAHTDADIFLPGVYSWKLYRVNEGMRLKQ